MCKVLHRFFAATIKAFVGFLRLCIVIRVLLRWSETQQDFSSSLSTFCWAKRGCSAQSQPKVNRQEYIMAAEAIQAIQGDNLPHKRLAVSLADLSQDSINAKSAVSIEFGQCKSQYAACIYTYRQYIVQSTVLAAFCHFRLCSLTSLSEKQSEFKICPISQQVFASVGPAGIVFGQCQSIVLMFKQASGPLKVGGHSRPKCKLVCLVACRAWKKFLRPMPAP